jgi:lipopolysaccharide/colanic/teichoic acid biosynthesis glycosyltransferase
VLKRSFDIGVAAVGLLLSAPLWLAIAAAIRLDDGGPVLLGQQRIGRRGRPFRALKFRSMIPDASRMAPRQAAEDDPRVTRVGRILRATAMDELPQLINILRGDMSMVGPRPLLLAEIEQRGDGGVAPLSAVPGFTERHAMRPGLTGLAQIFAARDITRRHKFRLDVLYIRHASFCFDIYLVLLSLWVTLRGRWEVRAPKI